MLRTAITVLVVVTGAVVTRAMTSGRPQGRERVLTAAPTPSVERPNPTASTGPTVTPASPTTPSPTTAAPTSTSSVSLAYAHAGVVVVGVGPDENHMGAAPSRLYLSTDSAHWRDVTPPQVVKDGQATFPFFETADFISPTTGWVTTFDLWNYAVGVYRTTDGGRSWEAEQSLRHGIHAGSGVQLQFTTATDGVEATFDPESNAPVILNRTTDGGAHWAPVSTRPLPTASPFVFSDATVGFDGDDGFVPLFGIYRTFDGGRTWSPFAPTSLPSTLAGQNVAYSLPVFFGHEGVMAALFSPSPLQLGGAGTLALFRTDDGGRSWRLATTRDVVRPHAPDGITQDPAVAIASPTTWWVTNPSPATVAGAPTLSVTSDAGAHWTSATGDLPTAGGVSLLPSSATDAWAVARTGGVDHLFVTHDGGQHWTVATPGR